MAQRVEPVVLVTGATDGIGLATAKELSRRGARVIVHGRSPAKAEQATAAVRAVGGAAPLPPLIVDLGRLSEVRAAGQALSSRGVHVDVLLNNAGVYLREPMRSADDLELTFAVNHLAPFALTHALLASEAGAELSRVVNVSSVAHTRGRIDLDDLGFERRGFDGYATYAASKLANVLFTVELARRLRSRGVASNALHPGVVSTKLLVNGMGARGGDTLAEGAATSVKLALDAELAGVSGRYFARGRPAQHHPAADDAGLVKRFYEVSAEMAGVDPLPG